MVVLALGGGTRSGTGGPVDADNQALKSCWHKGRASAGTLDNKALSIFGSASRKGCTKLCGIEGRRNLLL